MKNECLKCQCKSQPLNMKLGPFARDERTAYVENVLEVLNESRFGPHREYRLMTDLTNFAKNGQVFFDITPVGIFPSIDMEIYPRRFIEPIDLAVMEKHLAALEAIDPKQLSDALHFAAVGGLPSTFACGSPRSARSVLSPFNR